MREIEFLNSAPEQVPHPCLGFRFTPDEERRMRNAMIASARYMRTYGQGWNPDLYGVKEMLIRQEYERNRSQGTADS